MLSQVFPGSVQGWSSLASGRLDNPEKPFPPRSRDSALPPRSEPSLCSQLPEFYSLILCSADVFQMGEAESGNARSYRGVKEIREGKEPDSG